MADASGALRADRPAPADELLAVHNQ